MGNTKMFDASAALQLGQEVLKLEAESLTHIATHLGEEFTNAVAHILHCQGRLIVSGVGKSGQLVANSLPPLHRRVRLRTLFMPQKPPMVTLG